MYKYIYIYIYIYKTNILIDIYRYTQILKEYLLHITALNYNTNVMYDFLATTTRVLQ